jgi:hypothetical protein
MPSKSKYDKIKREPLKLDNFHYFIGLWLLFVHDPAHDFKLTKSLRGVEHVNKLLKNMPMNGGEKRKAEDDLSLTRPSKKTTDMDMNEIYEDELYELTINDLEDNMELMNDLYKALDIEENKRYVTRGSEAKRHSLYLAIEWLNEHKFWLLSLEPVDETIEQVDKNAMQTGGNKGDIFNKMNEQLLHAFAYVINNTQPNDDLYKTTYTMFLTYNILRTSNPSISPYILFNSYYLEQTTLFCSLHYDEITYEVVWNVMEKFVPIERQIDYRKLEPEPQTVFTRVPEEIQVGGDVTPEDMETILNIMELLKSTQNITDEIVEHSKIMERKLNETKKGIFKTIAKLYKQAVIRFQAHINMVIEEKKNWDTIADPKYKDRVIKRINYLAANYPTDACDAVINKINEYNIKINETSSVKSKDDILPQTKATVSKVLQIITSKFLTYAEEYKRSLDENSNDMFILNNMMDIANDIMRGVTSGIDKKLITIMDKYFDQRIDPQPPYLFYQPKTGDELSENPAIIDNAADKKIWPGVNDPKHAYCSWPVFLDAQGAQGSNLCKDEIIPKQEDQMFKFELEENNNDVHNYYGGFYQKTNNSGTITYDVEYEDISIHNNITIHWKNKLMSIQVLSASNTLTSFVNTLIQIWSTGPSNMDWNTRWSYFDAPPTFNTLLGAVHQKAIGDFFQEMNVIVKNGGYNEYKSPNIYRRGTMGDQPSGCRAIYYLYHTVNKREALHNPCDIGYYGAKSVSSPSDKGEKNISLEYNTERMDGGKKQRRSRKKGGSKPKSTLTYKLKTYKEGDTFAHDNKKYTLGKKKHYTTKTLTTLADKLKAHEEGDTFTHEGKKYTLGPNKHMKIEVVGGKKTRRKKSARRTRRKTSKK